jgi:signal transduction histidine kinase
MRLSSLAWLVVPAVIVVICTVVAIYRWSSVIDEYIRPDLIDVNNPSYVYWPTAQALRQFEPVRTDLAVIAKGYSLEPDAISFHIDILISSMNIIMRPSELNERFKRLPGFSTYESVLLAFTTHTLPSIKPAMSAADAQAMLPEVEAAYDALNSISKLALDQDTAIKQKSFETIQAGQKVILMIAGLLVFAIFAFAMISIFCWWAIVAKTRALSTAEDAVADKINFLAMISHELRTPLQVIVSALDVLERPQDIRTQNELTARIRRAANSLAVQLRDMLTLARAQAGYIELQPAVFDARELVREVMENYAAPAKAKHLELRQTIPDDAAFVVADGERIAQLVHNLVSNAVKYTQAGHVQVDLAPFDEKAGLLSLRVADTGPGLPARILESGFDAKGPLSLGSGRGIGLSVVQTLLRQLGARMTVSSPNNGGSVFEIMIPAASAERRSSGQFNTHKRVLVVDDHPDLLKGLSNVLEELGFAADIASSGMIALNYVAAHPYSAILIDLDMPIMTGAELAAQVRKMTLQHKPKLIAMSAANHGSKYDLSSFDDILTKPLRRQQLRTIMQF